ncbi:dihydrodipicolinate synthase family protein [Cellulomonas sp. P22]|uniref:dihydrodipicolinate synthase family protein n=1 Tax=Cellulomonas sp. P22 TaxID=3373189 RepID=UPI00378A6F2F
MPLLGALVPYLPTPRTIADDVAEDVLATLVERAVAGGASGVAVLGSTGGFAYLDREQRRRVARAAVEAAAGRVPVVVGVGELTTRDVLDLARDAEHAGADALLVPTMSYLPLTDDEVLELYRCVTNVVGIPVWAYHNPVATRYSFTVDALTHVARLPGVQGVKDRGTDRDAVHDRARQLHHHLPADVEIGFSGDALGVHGLLAGARTWHSGLAGVLPTRYAEVAAAAAAGDADRALALMAPLAPIGDLVASGGARVVHAVGEMLGLAVGPLPAPLRRPGPLVLTQIERALADLGDPA